MFISITTQQPTTLAYPIDNTCGNLSVALHEIFYKVTWFNISEAEENNWIERHDGHGNVIDLLTIPDGYYGFCALQEILNEYGIYAKLNSANLKISLTFKLPTDRQIPISYNFAGQLAKMLGFQTDNNVIYNFSVTEKDQTFEGQNPVNFAVHSLLYVQLEELNTDENLYNGRPSKVLRVFPSGTSAYCDPETKTFTNLQFKKLALGHYESLNLKITDQSGKIAKCDDLHVVLEIK